VDGLGFRIAKERVFFVDNSMFSVDLQKLTPEDLEAHTLNYQKSKDRMKIMLD
jgi:hypothetical protein